MSLFPNLETLRAAVFPETGSATPSFQSPGGSPVLSKVMDWIQKRSHTRPRSTATTLRHPDTQAGLVMSENGEAALRAGHTLYDHSVGASLILQPDGTVVITAPHGLSVSGSYFTTDNPTDALSFSGGQYRLHPQWTQQPVVIPMSNLPGFLDAFFVMDAKGDPIPLKTVFTLAAFYQTPPTALESILHG